MNNACFDNENSNHAPVIRKTLFRFYEELNDHLPDKWKKQQFQYDYKGKPSVKNTIQAIGVPHSEVDLILVNGEPVGFDYQMKGGESISVYPMFESLDISPLVRLRAKPLRYIRFVVDVNLGKLAQKLRLLGFDTLFRNDFEDDEIVQISLNEKRIILTRDRGILKQNAVTHGYWLRNDDPKKQLEEVVERLQLHHSFRPFTRCSNCNSRLKEISKEQLNGRLSADTLSFYDEFWECAGCRKIYWQGSHFGHILRWVDDLKTM
jgi:uncharacterized protein with PIN domain